MKRLILTVTLLIIILWLPGTVVDQDKQLGYLPNTVKVAVYISQNRVRG